jgi:glycogen synthase
MKVLMLGWEYPPHISGGLGTACQGLTTALAKNGVDIDFVVPKVFGDEQAAHMHLLAAHQMEKGAVATAATATTTGGGAPADESAAIAKAVGKGSVSTVEIPALLHPYFTPAAYLAVIEKLRRERNRPLTGQEAADDYLLPPIIADMLRSAGGGGGGAHYGSDLFAEVDRYTKSLVLAARGRHFDVIHAHDWMTYPAGVALSKLTGAPLVVHVHSLEFDRSGEHVNHRIHEIERMGLQHAHRVIAVSYYTRGVVHQQHGIPLDRISVVHNGVYSKQTVHSYQAERPDQSKIVLFLGRITFQKGPDYFVEAARRVIPLMPDVTFVMAGSGDMLPHLMNRVAELGLTRNFVFTGFLRGEEVEKIFSIADLYVMPSVSEPFGIAPLEAMSQNVPVIISRQSGVSEVLNSALKVDFWDVEKLAHFIVGVLKYPEMREDIVAMAREELNRLHWDAAGRKTAAIYGETIQQLLHR